MGPAKDWKEVESSVSAAGLDVYVALFEQRSTCSYMQTVDCKFFKFIKIELKLFQTTLYKSHARLVFKIRKV